MPIYYSNLTKGFYNTSAVNYPSLPADIIEISESQHSYLLSELNGNNKIIVITNGNIELEPRVISWNLIRDKRNNLLSSSDYTQLTDYSGDKTAWATYRQSLRDLPQTYSNPFDVVWPTPPV